MTDKDRTMSQSSELAGGAGFTFEDSIAAFYLSALVKEGYLRGNEDYIVHRIALQQRNFGEPLDDVIIDGRDVTGAPCRLSLQVKRSLIISAAKSNTDFREIIRDCWTTYQKPDFRKNVDRYGVATKEVAKEKARALLTLAEHARASVTTDHFQARFAEGGNASNELEVVLKAIEAILKDIAEFAPGKIEIHQFLAHFTLLEFDFLHEGASGPPEILTSLRDCLSLDQANQAPNLWNTLKQTARDGSGKSSEFFRPQLMRKLSRVYCLRAAPSLRNDLEKLTGLAQDWVKDIQNDVGGTHLDRASLAAELDQSLASSRLVQINGLPGSGKSVLLRQRIDVDLRRGPVIFLKSGRVDGEGWRSFAVANGISAVPLETLLVEIGATGSKFFYIDGIDRIEKKHQAVILDIVREIVRSPLLEDWKIIVSLRDTGIEPLRNWFSEALDTLAIGTVKVGLLDDAESEILAESKPALRALLFGTQKVRDIVRRPFFARILNHTSGNVNSISTFEPQSEVDLLDNWWRRGGYDAEGQQVLERQRALIEIAEIYARQLSEPIRLRQITPTTRSLIDQLIRDGILQIVAQGHTIRFSHDIFFEWSFFHALLDLDHDWLDAIRGCGEPPGIGRVVELMSQWKFNENKNWIATFDLLVTKKMRSQWTRAWLLGPLASSVFEKNETQFETLISANGYHNLKSLLVWFQAEKTTPNTNILVGDMTRELRIRIADILSWPSDFAAWRRLIHFLLKRIEQIPVALYPDMISVFEVWQNAFLDIKNPISVSILMQSAKWLSEIENSMSIEWINSAMPSEISSWKPISNLDKFRQSLVKLILKSSRVMPDLTADYLKRIIASEDKEESQFKQIVLFSPIIAVTHPELLVDLTLDYLKEELLEERLKREKRERQDNINKRKQKKDMSESEQVVSDLYIMADLPMFSTPRISYWSDEYAINDDYQNFFPPSPLREPFISLFKSSPVQVIRLVNELCNHAIAEWEQLHRHGYDSPGTPLPLEIKFPWGVQQFWGGNREYLWYRGLWAPKALSCGFMALEEWCFAELDGGRPVDDIIQQIVQGNKCIAILGIAATIALQTDRISEIVFSLITAQRLWDADHNRRMQEITCSSNLMGFNGQSDLSHISSIEEASKRPVRQKELRSLASRYVLSKDFGESAQTVISKFEDNLPFEMEEHRNNSRAIECLREQARNYAELADTANYVAKPASEPGFIEVVHVSPTALMEQNRTKAENAMVTIQEGNLWARASQAFENGKIDAGFNLSDAIKFVKKINSASLFDSNGDQEIIGVRRGAVTGIAAMVLQFREGVSESELTWARDTLLLASKAVEEKDAFSVPSSVIPWHHGLFVARGLAADLRAETRSATEASALLSLVAHPLEMVSITTVQQIATLWQKDKKLVWAAFHLAFTLSRIEPKADKSVLGLTGFMHSEKRIQEILKAAIKYYKDGKEYIDLPLPPPAWIKSNKRITNGQWLDSDFDENDVSGFRDNWIEPKIFWHSKYAAKIVSILPCKEILASEQKGQLLAFFSGALCWTIEKASPTWEKKGRRKRKSSGLHEWNYHFGGTLGLASGLLSLSEASQTIVPILALEDEACWPLLNSFVSMNISRYVYDAVTVPQDCVSVLSLCLERFLKSESFSRGSYRSGQFHGFDEPRLAEWFMFVSVEKATMAARYVNGDWTEIEVILPLIDRFIRCAGWSNMVMSHYLTLCERSKSAYPAHIFADQILAVIGESGHEELTGWNEELISSRIAGLIQHFAERETPMMVGLGQKLLRILDLLVDMGDRRSAALQLSESFREVRL